ncbi:MAG: mannose-1-phosphate guanylyltransferase [Prevotella sp.]|nr:mannose-1-phosphate guanylyltransferase [Prevotella sp.]
MNTTDTTIIDKLYALILAGGKGRRLWPESLAEKPKQFIDFFGSGLTQLQETYARFRQFLPAERILISTNILYKDIVCEQIPEATDDNILAEPVWRNTGPCTAWGAYRIFNRDNDALIVVSPADHHIVGNDKFIENVVAGARFTASHNRLLTMGVMPTRPEPGYGYIQFAEEIEPGIYTVKSFTEKPDREFARIFIESGEFLWNTSLLLSNARNLLQTMSKQLPAVFRRIKSFGAGHTIEGENRYIMERFPRYPNVSMEEGVLERTQDVMVMKCGFGWADMGTWHGIYESERRIGGDNVVLDSDVILDNAHNNIIKIPKGHLAVINGLDGYIVVEKGDTLLICPKEDSSALIRKYSAEVEIR